MYNEDEYLQLSGIQHFSFCRRQWALAYLELQWQDNVRTVEGKLLHEKAHDPSSAEKRGDIIISRAVPVHSAVLGVSGECDTVEFHRCADGFSLPDREGLYKAVPIEYKRGSPKITDADRLQLTAQAICLEEMLCCDIPVGFLYYGEIRHREKVLISNELRNSVKDIFVEMHKYYSQRWTPKVKWSKSCNACSLKDICLPVIGKKKSAAVYIEKMIEGDCN